MDNGSVDEKEAVGNQNSFGIVGGE